MPVQLAGNVLVVEPIADRAPVRTRGRVADTRGGHAGLRQREGRAGSGMSDFQGKVNFVWSVADEILRHERFRGRLEYGTALISAAVTRKSHVRVKVS